MLWVEAGRAASYLDSRRNRRAWRPTTGAGSPSQGFRPAAGRPRARSLLRNQRRRRVSEPLPQRLRALLSKPVGLHASPAGALGGLETQWYWNVNAGADLRRQYWANTVETGPGLRFRWEWMPAALGLLGQLRSRKVHHHGRTTRGAAGTAICEWDSGMRSRASLMIFAGDLPALPGRAARRPSQ